VTKSKYRNRLWAYIGQCYSEQGSEAPEIQLLGKEMERLDELFNGAVHGAKGKEDIVHGFRDLVALTAILLSLQPTYAKDPYFAYQQRIKDFLKELQN